MNTRIAEVRLTLYVLISAIEDDIRQLIRLHILPEKNDFSFIREEDVKSCLISRFLKDNPGLNPENNLSQVINYFEYQDTYKQLLANKDIVNPSIIKQIRGIVPVLDLIVPIRNRVMHSRPLLAGDFSIVFNFCTGLEASTLLPWENILTILNQLEKNPSFIFSYSIPLLQKDIIPHNLPIPDFDETGFIGRQQDITDLTRLIIGNNNVISLIGDGGIGKTSLMLKVAYDIVDMSADCPFHMIMWYSAKTTMLTAQGIEEVHNALINTSVILDKMASDTGAPLTTRKSTSDCIKEILEFMNTFKVLLILDNLETIYEEPMRDFLKEVSTTKSKIAITSRIGLGELEYRRLLKGLTEEEAASLVREISRVRNNETLLRLSVKQLSDIGKQLHFNPLALKWFVNSVDIGNSPQAVLQNKSNLLEFCLSNVYRKLSSNSKKILSTLLAARKPLNDAELVYLTELEPLLFRESLNQLFSTTLLKKDLDNKSLTPEFVYQISGFSREYLLKKHPPLQILFI